MSQHTNVPRYRKRYHLSQTELADLVSAAQSILSRCENSGYILDLRTALGLQVVFGRSPRALFPALYASVEEAVMRKAAKLDHAIRSKTDKDSKKKRELLAAMVIRSTPPAV